MLQKKAGTLVATVGALGVVFGDIGTSPLYALSALFALDPSAKQNIDGVISLVFWSITIIVTFTYVTFVLRADNDGEGGIMALAALIRERVRHPRLVSTVTMIAMIGAALFYGDSIITPAISVLSATEGLAVESAALEPFVVPAAIVILLSLFIVQHRGTASVGRAFGPIMVVWFLLIAFIGLPHIIAHPQILSALSPAAAASYVIEAPVAGFFALGAVVLTITGAEALYADMGHFGRRPISTAWFALVYPALTINYLGQGALMATSPEANPFFHLAPPALRWPVLIIATIATIIASQAVISGAFSVTSQAERLGFLPRMHTVQTSEEHRGQIYIPIMNWLLCAGVLILLVAFGSSDKLAHAYGIAVTGTLVCTTTLMLIYAKIGWGWSWTSVLALGVPVLAVELLFLAANLTKLFSNGWIPLVVAFIAMGIMSTWYKGKEALAKRHSIVAGSKYDFLDHLETATPPIIEGTAVYLRWDPHATPLSLKANVELNGVIASHIIFVRSVIANRPHTAGRLKVTTRYLDTHPKIRVDEVRVTTGFKDEINIPASLASAYQRGLLPDVSNANYFVSRINISDENYGNLSPWRRKLFVFLHENATRPTRYFHLPLKKTITIGTEIKL